MMRSPMTLREALFADYGPIMDSKAICKVLHYPSLNALHAAKARGALPFKTLAFENRKGIFALTEAIAAAIDKAAESQELVASEVECSKRSKAGLPHRLATAEETGMK